MGERRAGELGVLGVLVACEEERVAAVGGADEVVHAVAVLGDDHAAVGRDRDVVRPVDVVVLIVRRVCEVQLELDRLVTWVVEERWR